jgi:hypothetical protein
MDFYFAKSPWNLSQCRLNALRKNSGRSHTQDIHAQPTRSAVDMSQTLMVLSSLPEAGVRPSGETATVDG